MSNEPLYYSKKIQATVNPIKIVPNIARPSAQGPAQPQPFNASLLLSKEKKIVKADIRKHYRTKMCPHGRDCKRRFTCNFAHNEQELRKPFLKRKNPCILYQRGQCSLGSACRDYHGNMDLQKNYKYKEKVCEEYLKGNCGKGILCIFRHQNPEAEQSGQKQSQIEQQINEDRLSGEDGPSEKQKAEPQAELEPQPKPEGEQKQQQGAQVEEEKEGEKEEEEPLFITF